MSHRGSRPQSVTFRRPILRNRKPRVSSNFYRPAMLTQAILDQATAAWDWRRKLAAPAIALALSFLTAACAKPADEIAPSNLEFSPPPLPDCAVLMSHRAKAAEQLIFASIAQNQVAREDRERLFGVAPSMFGTLFRGDMSTRVADLKSELAEVEIQLTASGCPALYR